MNRAHLRTFASAHWFPLSMGALGSVILLLAAFEAGHAVGYREARFSYNLDQNFERNFGTQPGVLGDTRAGPGSHGTQGQIVSISLPTIMLSSPQGPELTVRVSSSTLIRLLTSTITPAQLQVGETIVVLGEPDDTQGEVQARLIRVVPVRDSLSTTTASR